MDLQVTLLTPRRVLYEGKAKSVMLPGEAGEFEVLPYHKRIISRLFGGIVDVDGRVFPIRRGIAKVIQNNVTVIVEEDVG